MGAIDVNQGERKESFSVKSSDRADREEIEMMFIAWKLAKDEAKEAEREAALKRLNEETAEQLFFKKMSERVNRLYGVDKSANRLQFS